ncbi:MAG: peptidylprolyl isomerase [Gammaproteobacteria bacterium]|nr:peptidylprolyl isomerase [Gammaproteobacteria bacterium]
MNLLSMCAWRRGLLLAAAGFLLATLAHAQGAAAPRVQLSTSMGDIVVELYPDKAPRTVENFLQYVKDKHYDGTVFHRVIAGFMIQGGGMTTQLREKPARAPIPIESANGLKNERSTLAMARTSNPNSATAQFFINVVDNDFLNHTSPTPQGWGYAVFGKVVQGMDVVDKIRAVPTGNMGMHQNVPLAPITINAATVLPAKQP